MAAAGRLDSKSGSTAIAIKVLMIDLKLTSNQSHACHLAIF